MISRYTLDEMGNVWTDENRFRKILQVEIAVCEALYKKKKIPEGSFRNIEERADFDIQRVYDIEKRTKHDLIAFLEAVSEKVGPDSRFIHKGLTSSDVLDTGLALQLIDASDILIKDIRDLIGTIKKKAKEEKWTVMIGRTHGVHAEPITFGFKLACWFSEMERNLERLKKAKKGISVGKISGAVGTYANIDPDIEIYVCKKLGLSPAPISTQILQRDIHAEYMTTLAIISGSLEKFATEIRNLQRTEILEAEEFFEEGQKGSSAMPHKKNPITAEQICGLSRVVRTNALSSLENISLWHERDITHSSVERIIIPDSTILLDYILVKFNQLLKNLVVHRENMKRNLEEGKNLIFSQRVLLKLVEKGLEREDAYKLVQRNAMLCWGKNLDLKDELIKDKDVRKYLKPAEIKECFDIKYYIRHIDRIFKRLRI